MCILFHLDVDDAFYNLIVFMVMKVIEDYFFVMKNDMSSTLRKIANPLNNTIVEQECFYSEFALFPLLFQALGYVACLQPCFSCFFSCLFHKTTIHFMLRLCSPLRLRLGEQQLVEVSWACLSLVVVNKEGTQPSLSQMHGFLLILARLDFNVFYTRKPHSIDTMFSWWLGFSIGIRWELSRQVIDW